MRLVDVYHEPGAAQFLYRLMLERPPETWISHAGPPTFDEHLTFMSQLPFHRWYLIDPGRGYVGALECTDRNELGIAILKNYQRSGYATQALQEFMAHHKPLPAIPAIRNGAWVANVAPTNTTSIEFWHKHGFEVRQYTMVKR